jgi:hypothetical protein
MAPWEALVSEPSRSMIEKSEGLFKLPPLPLPALAKVPREDSGTSKSLLVLILGDRISRHPRLVTQKNLGRGPQTPPAWGAAAEMAEQPFPISRS